MRPGGGGQPSRKDPLVSTPISSGGDRFPGIQDPVVLQSLGNWTGNHFVVETVDTALCLVFKFITGAEVAQLPPSDIAPPRETGILVFLSGWDEIKVVNEHLAKHELFGNRSRFLVLPLHSQLPPSDQRAVFRRPPDGVVKIIISTNIAETSLTIDDVGFVVDAGRAKEKTYDPVNDLECLLPAFVSRAASRQRRGRAGRTGPGVCLRLYPRWHYDAVSEYQAPELLRTPLAGLCLQVKSMGLDALAGGHPGGGSGHLIRPFLARALEPPDPRAVDHAVDLLETIGALDPHTEELTALGRHLALLPVEPRIGKVSNANSSVECFS